MNSIIGFKLHTGIIAICKQPEPTKIDPLSSPVVILNGIINSENVGSIVRNCSAFGINSLISNKQTSSPFLRRAVWVSMGAVFGLNYYYTYNLEETINELKKNFCFLLFFFKL